MAETVSTGGLKQFVRPKGYSPKPTKEYKLEIDEAYNKYYERRKHERKRRTLLWIIIALIVLIGLGIWWVTRR
ncbi:hypothetical protein J4233_02600 [Candidatus Pacearchaeota archaeon]|nr:hypothetical protein [Candidatus Pacearchaeota archaeon]